MTGLSTTKTAYVFLVETRDMKQEKVITLPPHHARNGQCTESTEIWKKRRNFLGLWITYHLHQSGSVYNTGTREWLATRHIDVRLGTTSTGMRKPYSLSHERNWSLVYLDDARTIKSRPKMLDYDLGKPK